MADTSQTSEKGTRITYRCSFCGKDQQQVRRLIAGPGGVYICNECVALCQEIINEEAVASDQQTSSGNWVTTTRSQTSVSGKDESAAPTPTPCPECQSQRMLATLVPGLRVAASEDLLPGIMGRWSQMQAVVCPSCGYTTFYAKNPDKLAK